MRAPLAAALLALLLAPAAAAHGEAMDQSSALALGDKYYALFQPRPTPPYAGDTVSFSVLLSERTTGMTVTRVDATVIVGGPNAFNERRELVHDGTGYLVGSVVVPEAGTYSARLLVRDPQTDETVSADAEFEVYPDLPVRIRPVEENADAEHAVFVGRLTPLAFEIVDGDTLARVDPFDDLRIRVEHWTDNHTQLLDSRDAQPRETSPGLWRIDERFDAPGMYHIRFASDAGGFTYGDVPLLHVYANPAPTDDGANVPAPPLLLALAGAGAAALLLRRR